MRSNSSLIGLSHGSVNSLTLRMVSSASFSNASHKPTNRVCINGTLSSSQPIDSLKPTSKLAPADLPHCPTLSRPRLKGELTVSVHQFLVASQALLIPSPIAINQSATPSIRLDVLGKVS